MRIMLATLCLNEMQWLPRSYEQHQDWPGIVEWVFVEAADVVYARKNPDRVSLSGTSVDGTTTFLEDRLFENRKIQYVKHGLTSHPTDPSQGKIEARNRYLDIAEDVRPDFVIVIDADEFYPTMVQRELVRYLQTHLDNSTPKEGYTGFRLRQRHVWNPPGGTGSTDVFKYEVVGGYWDVPHTRIWRWRPGMRYRDNHNWPADGHGRMDRKVAKLDLIPEIKLECVHTGYASDPDNRRAKHQYYKARGEGSEGGKLGRKRQMYVDCRREWETWVPGSKLSHGARVIPYTGPVPEALR